MRWAYYIKPGKVLQMADVKFLTIKAMQERYGINRAKAEEIAHAVGTAPRRKGQTIYVNQAKADKYMRGGY